MLPNNTVLQGRYRIVEQIGRGGMGAVYRATDARLRTLVALKQMLVEGEAFKKAFEREAQLLAGLRHPSLPRVSDHFIEENGQFLVMEYIPGDDLGTLLDRRQQPFPVADALRWADQLLDALDFLHTHHPPVIHRDIKPQNLKLTDRNQIILLDFGLAKGSSLQTRITSTGSIFGYTPHYAPIEQIHGTGTDPRSDLYSLAATLYHLVTGRVPVDAVTRASAVVNDDPDPLVPANAINPEVPPAIARIIQQAMSQRAKQRPQTAVEMREALQGASKGIPPARRPPESDPTVVDMEALPSIIQPDRPPPVPPQPATLPRAIPSPTTLPRPAPEPGPSAAPTGEAPAARKRSRRWLWLAMLIPVLLAAGAFAVFAAWPGGLLGQTSPTAAPAVGVAPTDDSASLAATATSDALNESRTQTASAEAAKETANETVTALAAGQAADETASVVAATEAANQIGTAVAATQAANETAEVLAATQAANETAEVLAATQAANQTAEALAAAQAANETANAIAAQVALEQTRAALPPPTPRPTAAPAATREAQAECRVQGRGSRFVGSCSPGSRIAGQSGGCITGRIATRDGQAFQTVLLSVDNKGNTIRVPLDRGSYDPGSGTYSVCGLGAGEWGVAIINVNRGNGIEENPSGGSDQVILRLSGTDGEHAIVNIREQ